MLTNPEALGLEPNPPTQPNSKRHHLDLVALVAYVSGGGLAAYGTLLSAVWPGHSALWLGISGALISTAGAIRTQIVPATTQTATVVDETTKQVVPVAVDPRTPPTE